MYWKIELLELPRIRFAHSHSTSSYDMRFEKEPDFMELCCYQQGDCWFRYEDEGEQYVQAPAFVLRDGSRNYRIFSRETVCSHITVGLESAKRIQRISREELLRDYQHKKNVTAVFYLPVNGLRIHRESAAESLLQQLIYRFSLSDAEQSLRCTSVLFELLAVLTAESVREAMLHSGTLSASGLRIAQNAVGYIMEHISENLNVEALSRQLNVSPGYLRVLFKAYTGESVIRYMNGVRIRKIQELMVFRNLTLREAGELTGLQDENYCSRLFRQYTGMSAREYLAFRRIEAGGGDRIERKEK